MAFKSKNSPLITPFLFLILLINFSNNSQKVNGDATLIQNVCKQTPYPKVCLGCFSDDKGAVQMTVRELAGSSVYCTYNLSRKLEDTFAGLAAKSDKSNELKKAYQLCGSALHQFAVKMAGTQTWLWQYNDEEAKKEFNGAKGDYVTCQGALDGFINGLPTNLVEQFKGLNSFYKDSYNIILQAEKTNRKM